MELIIFDCDGVLVDSDAIANKELRQALADCGLDMTIPQVVETFVGFSMLSILKISEEMLGHQLQSDFLEKLQQKTFAAFRRSLKPVKDVAYVLEELSKMDKKICVASSGSPEKINFTLGLTNLAHYFEDNIFTSGQVKRDKPYPDLYLYAAHQMNIDPSQCLVIEDRLPGVQGAIAAGMEVLAYSVGGQANNLATAGGMIFSDIKYILEYID